MLHLWWLLYHKSWALRPRVYMLVNTKPFVLVQIPLIWKIPGTCLQRKLLWTHSPGQTLPSKQVGNKALLLPERRAGELIFRPCLSAASLPFPERFLEGQGLM